jgi:hypothetical protein
MAGRLRKIKNKLISVIARFLIIPKLRITLYRCMGIKIGKQCYIGTDCIFDDEYPELLSIVCKKTAGCSEKKL